MKTYEDRRREPLQIAMPCEACGRQVGTYVPKQGDGSERWVRPHKNSDKTGRCEGRKALWADVKP